MKTNFFLDKVCIVTGGTSGIGKALVEQLLLSNAYVVTCARHEDKLKELKNTFPNPNLLVTVVDIESKKQCEHLINICIKTFGKIDILINNAGMSMRNEFDTFELESFEKLMQINFMGTVYVTKYALPHLIHSKGYLVGIASIAGFRATPGRSAYSASKFAMVGFLESLRLELKKYGIKVLTIAPGFVASNIRKVALHTQSPQKKMEYYTMDEKKIMSADFCASLILASIRHNQQRSFYSALGKCIVILNKFFPTLTDRLIYNFYYKNNMLIK